MRGIFDTTDDWKRDRENSTPRQFPDTSDNLYLIPYCCGSCFDCPDGEFEYAGGMEINPRQAVRLHIIRNGHNAIFAVQKYHVNRKLHAECMDPVAWFEQECPA